jgi:hypothetical protein
MKRHIIKSAKLRRYSDSGQLQSQIEWGDGSTTVGAAEMYHGLMIPSGSHMGSLFDRAIRDGLTIEREVW